MNILVPYANTARARAALGEAIAMVEPGDRITVIAVVAVPAYYAPDVEPGIVWVQACRAKRLLGHARAQVAAVPDGVTVRCVRVQASDEATAIVRGAEAYGADLILFTGRAGPLGDVTRWFGTVGTVARHAPCGVRVVTAARQPVVPSGGIAVAPKVVPVRDAVLHLFRRQMQHVRQE